MQTEMSWEVYEPPQVDAPIAALCLLFGSTVPFGAAHLASLYKSHRQFVVAWSGAIKRDRADGFLLRADAAELSHSAVVSKVARHDR
jgi:hypothetical protein